MRKSVFDRLCIFGVADTRSYSYEVVFDSIGFPSVVKTHRESGVVVPLCLRNDEFNELLFHHFVSKEAI